MQSHLDLLLLLPLSASFNWIATLWSRYYLAVNLQTKGVSRLGLQLFPLLGDSTLHKLCSASSSGDPEGEEARCFHVNGSGKPTPLIYNLKYK